MITATASAPGKVVLSGEYAVLDGAPAVSMAVNRRAIVTLTATADNKATVESVGPAGDYDPGLFDCAVKASHFSNVNDYSFVLDTSAFIDAESGVKFGIGSSAALTVALVKAFSALAADETDVGEIAAIAHIDFQQGSGSGVDIATSVAGGLVEFRTQEMGVTELSWPAGLEFAMFWSGVAASTRDRVDRLAAIDTKPSRARLSDEASAIAMAWKSGKADAVMAASRNYNAALMTFSVDHDLGIFEAGHDILARAALADGLVYKPCGAGGGDVGIALATDREQLSAFTKRAKASGFEQLDIGLDSNGVQLKMESD